MGGVGGTNAAPPLSLVDVFERACPVYMSYGMSYDQFWDGDVSAHRAYREAHKLALKERNAFMHIQAAYFYEALCCASSLFRGMKPSRPQNFRTEPYDIFEEDIKRRKEQEERERYERIREKVAAFAKAFNAKKHEEREVDSDAGCKP